MRDLKFDELEQVYGAGGTSKCGCGSSPTPPSGGSRAKSSVAKNSKGNKSNSGHRGSKGYC